MMVSLLSLAAFVLPAAAQVDFFDPALVQEAQRAMAEATARIEVQNSLPRIPPGSPEAQGVYNALFPYYAEICAVTVFEKKGSKPGGSGGHAIMFINGAEIDPSAGYPKLRLAPEGTDLSGPDSGVGISVNKVFANVNWVAIPGRDMFFHGGLSPTATLEPSTVEALVAKASAQTWFDGIRPHDEQLQNKPPAMPVKEFMVRSALGTDFAITFARSAYCSRLPLSREGLGKVLNYLNARNVEARANGYQWNGLTNNCSHIPHNALAEAGVWDPKKIRGAGHFDRIRSVVGSGVKSVFGLTPDLSFPANNFVRLYEAGNTRPIGDVFDAFHNHDVRRTMQDGWTSTGPGALVATYAIHDASLNRVYQPGKDPLLASVPLLWDKRSKFDKLTREPPAELTDLGANLASYSARYKKTLDEAPGPAQGASRMGTQEERKAYVEFYDRFYEQTARRSRETDAALEEYRRRAASK
ncbi:MAG: hypothetical protein HY925_07390 [Elusimicrobia bacterium]|nr:hypothetical protein [Elusimicrobiota bacterium]